jgi:PAS domain S-box-containing protein
MDMHRLLEKQIRKYFTPESLQNKEVTAFLAAVNNSYNAYDRDQALSAHASRISELEYMEINQRLKEELSLKETGLKTLKEVIKRLGDLSGSTAADHQDDLIGTLAYLDKHIEQRKEMETELRRLSLVASVNENGVIFTNPAGVIFWANDGFTRLTGYSMDEIIGKTPIQLCKGKLSGQGILKGMMKAFLTGKTFNIEAIHYRKDRSWFWGKAKGQAVLDQQGKITQYFAMVEDITHKKKSEELLRKNEEKYRGIISNMNLGLLEVDLKGRIQFVNQSFCKLSGYTSEELVGRKAASLFMTEEGQILMAQKDALRLQGISDAYEMEARNREGEQRWWLISGSPRYNDHGEITGSVGIHLDITDHKKLEIDLIKARRQAEESSRSKEAFLANMSHEIRTPMNAILGMGRQLDKTTLNIKQRLYLDTINAAGENLLVVINDILDISKIEAGKLVIEHIGFRMKDALTKVMRVMRYKAEERGLRLAFYMGEGLPPVLMGDPYRLNQVMLNLVSNAIKFTEKGLVTVHCYLKHKKENLETICIQVTDTGIGMDEVFLKHLFQKFMQEDPTVARKYGGTGLGMSISKQLIELMQGTIEVRSVKGKGTVVDICIPYIPGKESDLLVNDETVSNIAVLQGKKILLVEDNEMNRLVAIAVLNNYGAVVSEATNGAEAVEAVKKNHYDLVLMDMQMPVMDGFEATRIIREETGNMLPIIALTANAIKGENDKCIAAGMNDYISKPFEEGDMVKVIGSWLGKEVTVSPAPAVPAENIPLYSLCKLEQIGQGNDAFVKKMLQLFLQEVPSAVQCIARAYKDHDFATMKACAHRIKPILGNLCIVSLKDEIKEIELAAKESRLPSELGQLIHKLESVIALVATDVQNYLKQHDSNAA